MDRAFRDATGRYATLMETLLADPSAKTDGSDVFARNIVRSDPTAGAKVAGRSGAMQAARNVAGLHGELSPLSWYARRGGGVFIDGWSDVFDWTAQKPGRTTGAGATPTASPVAAP